MTTPDNYLEQYRREQSTYGMHHVPEHLREQVLGGVLLRQSRSEMEHNPDPIVETPAQLYDLYPLSPEAELEVAQNRKEVSAILNGEDPRLLIIEGPCSLDSKILEDGSSAPIRVAQKIQSFADSQSIKARAKVIGRFPPRKPRTDLGHAGLQQKDRNLAHKLISKVSNSKLGVAIEMLQDHDFSYYKRYLTLGWVGARDSGSTVLRHEVSNNPDIPILFKTGEDGTLDKALKSVKTARGKHPVEYRDQDGVLRSRMSEGNKNVGIIIRGGTNIKTPEDLQNLIFEAEKAGVPYHIDCAHGVGTIFDPKSEKSVQGQLGSLDFLINLVAHTDPSKLQYFKGVLIEAYLTEGTNHDAPEEIPGRSATDPCITIEDSHHKIEKLLHAREYATANT